MFPTCDSIILFLIPPQLIPCTNDNIIKMLKTNTESPFKVTYQRESGNCLLPLHSEGQMPSKYEFHELPKYHLMPRDDRRPTQSVIKQSLHFKCQVPYRISNGRQRSLQGPSHGADMSCRGAFSSICSFHHASEPTGEGCHYSDFTLNETQRG